MNKIIGVFLLLLCNCAFSYNYQSTVKIPVKIHIKNGISTQKDLYEGEKVDFIVAQNVYYKRKLIAKSGDTLTSKVQIIISSGMNGIPASVIFNNFELNGIESSKFSRDLEVFGQDRSMLVFPLKWALTPLPPTGSLTNFIKGGRVKIKTNKIFTIYYYPEWE